MRSTFFITVRKNKDLIIEENAHKKLTQILLNIIITINEFTNTGNVYFFNFDIN
jgi:hypothetical protein